MSITDEYKALREELLYHYKIRDQITFLLLTIIFGFSGYNLWFEETNIFVLSAPVYISFISYVFYTLRSLYILKIDSYIRIKLEKDNKELNWHTEKRDFSLGVYKLGKRLTWIVFFIPLGLFVYRICVISYTIGFINFINNSSVIINLIGILLLIMGTIHIEYQKRKTLRDLDKRWRFLNLK